MADDHLRSIHLDSTRRKDFRRARDVLMGACGSHTRALQPRERPEPPPPDDARTIVQQMADKLPAHLDHWLMDNDGIYPLKLGVNTLGRLPDNDVVIHGPYVSRRHCAILVHASDSCELHDIASKNGTFLNGRPLAGPTPLAAGDEIRTCDRTFVFCSKYGPAAQNSPDRTLAE